MKNLDDLYHMIVDAMIASDLVEMDRVMNNLNHAYETIRDHKVRLDEINEKKKNNEMLYARLR